MTFDDWQNYFFTAAELADPMISAPGADPDGDELSNLIEYYLGEIPTRPKPAEERLQASIVQDAANQWLTLTVTTPQSLSEIQGSAQVSSDLESWSSAPADIAEILPAISNEDGTRTRTFRVQSPLSFETRIFVRLLVELN